MQGRRVRVLTGGHTRTQSRAWGERQRGPWPRHQGQQRRRPEDGSVETPDTIDAIGWGQRARRPRTRARHQVQAGQGPGGEKGLFQPSTPPTMAGAAGREQAPLLLEKLGDGVGEGSNFLAPTLNSSHQNKPDLKKKIPSPNCAAAPAREQRSILHPPPPPSSPPPTPPPPNT